MVRVLRGGNIDSENYIFKTDDVFISDEFVKPELFLKKNWIITPAVSSIEHIGKIALLDKDYNDVVVGGFVLMLIPTFSDETISKYLFYAFATKYHRDNCRKITHKSGQAFYNVSREKMMNLLIPVPPRNEMKKLIKKLEQVLPYIEEYDNVDVATTQLVTSFPEQLKKSILQEAIQGKLVPQDPNEEPASVLLERIRAEKERLIAEGKIKRDKHESRIFKRDNSHYELRDSVEVCIDDEIPFDIPESWEWARLSSFGVFSSGKTPTMADSQNWAGTIPWISSKDMKSKYINDSEMHLTKEGASSMRLYPKGTLLLVARSGILKRLLPLCILNIESTINQDIKAFSLYDQRMLDWLFYSIKAFEPMILRNLVKSVTTVESLKFEEFSQMLIPIPPRKEQHRIVDSIHKMIHTISHLHYDPLFSL